MIHAYAISD